MKEDASQTSGRTQHEVADVIRDYGQTFLKRHKVAPQVERVLGRLAICRTSALGGHVDACPECGEIRISYNSCRDRHCPKCQGKERELWIEKRREEVIPTVYYHCVFTVPHQLNAVAMANMYDFYRALFIAAWATLDLFFREHWPRQKKGFPPLKGAMTALLHTWGANLSFHPHLHCIVPGGGVDSDGKWHDLPKSRKNGTQTFLFPVRSMSLVFRAKLIAELDRRGVDIPPGVRYKVTHMPWNINTRPTVKGVEKVIDYLGRYAYRVAIGNNRIKDISSDGMVTFDYKDYRSPDENGAPRHKLLTITADEFLRRFSWHILPPGLVRIRHYGLLAPCNRKKLRQVQVQLDSEVVVPERKVRLTYAMLCERRGRAMNECPCCHCEMVTIGSFPLPRSPTRLVLHTGQSKAN